MKKRIVAIGLIMVTGCASAMKKASGIYELQYQKYAGDPDTARTKEVWNMILYEDGTGKSNHNGGSYSIKWTLSGENIEIVETFGSSKHEFKGTYKDGVIDAFDGDKNNILTLEVVFNKI